MKLLRNFNPNVWEEVDFEWTTGDWKEVNPFDIQITASVLLVEVYDDLQMYINGKSIVWATYDDRDYYALAKAMPEMLYSIADALGYEPHWLRVEFPDIDGEEDPLAYEWEWENIYDFILGGNENGT